MRILALLLLAGCAAEETTEPPATTAHAHGYRHHAQPNPDERDTSANDQARATQQTNDEMAREASRAHPTATASPTAVSSAAPQADQPDPWIQHQKTCRASFGDRMNTALADLRSFDSSKTQIVARCKSLEPKCVLTGDRHVLGCKGVTTDDASFVESVCTVLPQVVAIDESKDCSDVDKPVLQVRYGTTSTATKQAWLDELKQVNADLKAQIEARDAKK